MSDHARKEGGSPREPSGARALPQIDFATFVLSLSTTALCQLGLVPDPLSGKLLEPDRVLARQTIDTLEMLRTKTRGNLDDDERRLLDTLLYELRLKFVEAGD